MSSEKITKKIGRPRRNEKESSIRIYESTMKLWNELKAQSDYNRHNDFARHLLTLFENQITNSMV